MSCILSGIRNPSDKIKAIVAQLRAEPDKAKRTILKKDLPAIVWGADITTRDPTVANRELSRSGLICLDLDAVPDLAAARGKLQEDPHVAATWLSPSGDGLKCLVVITGTWEAHWRALDHHVRSTYGLECDASRRDVYGLCFVSHDPGIWIAPDMDLVEPFTAIMDEPSPVRHQSLGAQPNSYFFKDGETLEDFGKYDQAEIPLRLISPDLPYGEWIQIGQAIHCQFAGSAEGLALWDSWSSGSSKYEGGPVLEKHYRSFRSSGVTFRTVLRKAIDAGWKRPKSAPIKEYRHQVSQTRTVIRDHYSDIIAGKITSISIPWPSVDRTTQALSPGTITLLVGTPGATKSWLILQSIIMWHGNGVPFAALELEQDYTFWIKRILALLSSHGGMARLAWVAENPDLALSLLAQNEVTAQKIMESFHIGGGFTVEQTIQWLKDQGRAGKRVVTIDPITMLDTTGGKEHEAAKQLMDQASKVAQKYGMSIVVVTHNTSLAGLKGNPTLDQVAGGKGYTRFADTVFWLSPTPKDTSNKVMIRKHGVTYLAEANRQLLILKSRAGTGVGEVVCLQFDEISTVTNEVGFLSYDKEPTGIDPDSARGERMRAAISENENVF